jgi:hypothetical protein
MAKGDTHVFLPDDVACSLMENEPIRGHNARIIAYVKDDEYVFYLSAEGLRRLYRQIGRSLGEPQTGEQPRKNR